MTYAFTQDVPIDGALYQRIVEGVGPDTPQGLILHLAIERPEGGLRYIDVWESEEDSDRFAEERLHPVVHPLLGEVFDGDLPDEPSRTEIRVVHMWGTAVTGIAH